MAKASVKRRRMDDFEIKSKDVFKVFLRYREIRERLKLKGNQDETEGEATEEPDSSDAEVDILGCSDEEKSNNGSTVIKESYNSQKSKSGSSRDDVTVHKCMYKGCGKSFKSRALFAQHTHNHTIEELKKSFCGKPEERQPETNESQECLYDASYDDEISVNNGEKADVESSVFRESHDSQNLKKTEPDAQELKDSSDDASYEDEVSASDDEERDARSGVCKMGQKNWKLKTVKASSGTRLSVHVCPYENCDRFFSKPFRLAQHVRTHTGERPYVCPSESCSKSYTRQQHLKRHIEVSHKEKEAKEKLKCAMCDLMLSNVYCLRKHILRHHVTRNHKCSECGKTFTKQQQLQKHSYVHTGINPFPCDYPDCEMRCLTLSRLKRHKLIHQKSRYACPQELCQQKFDTYKDLQHHFVADHPKVCDICDRPFRQLRSLRKHRLTHENTVQVYFCTYPACDRYYTQLNNLTTHIREKHTHMKIYECGICDKRLSSKQKLIHHMTTHSSGYKRNYASEKPRKPRKDKGCIRLDYARLLSGYNGPEEGEGVSQVLQPEITAEDRIDGYTCPNISPNPLNKVLTGTENDSSDCILEAEEI